MRNILIIGAGSVGGHVACNLDDYLGDVNLLGFLDDDRSKIGKEFVGYQVLGPISDISKYDEDICLVICITQPKIKENITKGLINLGYNNFPVLISKNSWISNKVSIGKGSIIYPGSHINYNGRIKDFVIININCAIGHDCTIGSFSSLSPTVSLGGHTKIGERVKMGIGSSSLQFLSIGDNVIVGGQCMITKTVPKNSTVIGVPGIVK